MRFDRIMGCSIISRSKALCDCRFFIFFWLQLFDKWKRIALRFGDAAWTACFVCLQLSGSCSMVWRTFLLGVMFSTAVIRQVSFFQAVFQNRWFALWTVVRPTCLAVDGLPASWGIAQNIESFIYGDTPRHPETPPRHPETPPRHRRDTAETPRDTAVLVAVRT